MDDGVQRPVDEALYLPKKDDQSLADDWWHAMLRIVQPQQHAQQVMRLDDGLWHDPEDVSQREVLGGVIAKHARRMLLGCGVERVEIRPIHGGDHCVTEARKKLAKAERYAVASLQKVEWDGDRVRVEHDDQARRLRTLPPGAEDRLVRVPEGHRAVEVDDVEAPLPDSRLNVLLSEQTIGVVHEREAVDAWRELAEDSVVPVDHGCAASTPSGRWSPTTCTRNPSVYYAPTIHRAPTGIERGH